MIDSKPIRMAPPKSSSSRQFNSTLEARSKSALARAKVIVTWPWRAFYKLCFYVGLFTLSVIGILVLISVQFYASLPNLETYRFQDFKALTQKRVEQRREGKGPRPSWVSLSQVSKPYLYALVMSEDSSFFEHDGIELDSMVASALNNLRKKKIESGASTLSQQVVKNLFLTQDRTLRRKLKEVLLTQEMEKRLTKNEILELYFNLIEVGPDLYGVGIAAQHYFKKQPRDMNAAEGAFVALMLPSPRKFHFAIFENRYLPPDKYRKLRRILSDLLSQDLISPQQYRQYLHYPFFKNSPVH